jgi:hypothetical protein
MSPSVTRNAVIALLVLTCAMALFFAPAANLVFSLFLLVVGIAFSTMVYLLWHQPPVAVALVAPRSDTARRESGSTR